MMICITYDRLTTHVNANYIVFTEAGLIWFIDHHWVLLILAKR
jgi:hypothetical protein